MKEFFDENWGRQFDVHDDETVHQQVLPQCAKMNCLQCVFV